MSIQHIEKGIPIRLMEKISEVIHNTNLCVKNFRGLRIRCQLPSLAIFFSLPLQICDAVWSCVLS